MLCHADGNADVKTNYGDTDTDAVKQEPFQGNTSSTILSVFSCSGSIPTLLTHSLIE